MKYESFYDLLHKAVNGDIDAIDEILRLYMPLINSRSITCGKLDEDCKQHIMMDIVKQLPKFQF